jgi:hypothetical protein
VYRGRSKWEEPYRSPSWFVTLFTKSRSRGRPHGDALHAVPIEPQFANANGAKTQPPSVSCPINSSKPPLPDRTSSVALTIAATWYRKRNGSKVIKKTPIGGAG